MKSSKKERKKTPERVQVEHGKSRRKWNSAKVGRRCESERWEQESPGKSKKKESPRTGGFFGGFSLSGPTEPVGSRPPVGPCGMEWVLRGAPPVSDTFPRTS